MLRALVARSPRPCPLSPAKIPLNSTYRRLCYQWNVRSLRVNSLIMEPNVTLDVGKVCGNKCQDGTIYDNRPTTKVRWHLNNPMMKHAVRSSQRKEVIWAVAVIRIRKKPLGRACTSQLRHTGLLTGSSCTALWTSTRLRPSIACD
jgi:hypothetical protein